jgi:hypothetical protein
MRKGRAPHGVGDACAKAGDGFGGDTELAVLVDMRGDDAQLFGPTRLYVGDEDLGREPVLVERRRCKGPGLQASTQHDDRVGRLDDIVHDPGLGGGFEERRAGKPAASSARTAAAMAIGGCAPKRSSA